jgi:hypothetical protein
MVCGCHPREGGWDTSVAGLAPSKQTVVSTIRVILFAAFKLSILYFSIKYYFQVKMFLNVVRSIIRERLSTTFLWHFLGKAIEILFSVLPF